MSRKKIIIISIVVLVVIGAAVALVLTDSSFFMPISNVNQGGNLNNQNANLPDTSSKGFEPSNAEAAVSPVEQTVKTLARNFAERYGSYSSDANFQNLKEVKPLVTTAFAKQLDQVIASGQSSDDYYGVSSKALKVNLVSVDEAAGSASVEVMMQRSEQRGNEQPFIYNQQLNLELTNANNNWLVSEAEWQ